MSPINVESLYSADLFPEIIAEIDAYVGNGKAKGVALAPLRWFLQEYNGRGPDFVPTYEDYAAHPALIYSLRIALGCMASRAIEATSVCRPNCL